MHTGAIGRARCVPPSRCPSCLSEILILPKKGRSERAVFIEFRALQFFVQADHEIILQDAPMVVPVKSDRLSSSLQRDLPKITIKCSPEEDLVNLTWRVRLADIIGVESILMLRRTVMQVVGIPVSAPRTDPASLGPTRKCQTDIGISFSSDAVGLFEAPTPMP